MKIHSLKTDPYPFQQSWSGIKKYELRYDDRGFEVGDGVHLNETLHSADEMIRGGHDLEYTGRQISARIVHICRNSDALKEGWVILSFDPATIGKCNNVED